MLLQAEPKKILRLKKTVPAIAVNKMTNLHYITCPRGLARGSSGKGSWMAPLRQKLAQPTLPVCWELNCFKAQQRNILPDTTPKKLFFETKRTEFQVESY